MANPCYQPAQQVEYLFLNALTSARAAAGAEGQAVALAFIWPFAIPSRIEAALFWRKMTAVDLDECVKALTILADCAGDNGASPSCVQAVLEIIRGIQKLSLAMTAGHPEIHGFIAELETLHTRYGDERAGCDMATQPVELMPATEDQVALELTLEGGFPGGPRRRFATPHEEAKRDDATTLTLSPGLGRGGPRILVRVDTYDVASWTVRATVEVVGPEAVAHGPYGFAWEWDGVVVTAGVASTSTTSSIEFVVDSSPRARRLRVTAQGGAIALERAVLVATPLTRTESHALPGGAGFVFPRR